ncbi:exodeoxyribonuclease VII small subunit [Clostridium tetanomorphum]|uniref:Exodeoxyribonuclease 7 small subunit n=1 Tax=Clostridium tetanomorphum TaxID=1553 RepID=A0A923E8V4_CLOTT|nr:exodeoxyribonuclease VII small subunit [Clostridium tetanomorphum]KAJ51476.1 exodeoxyribonuclease VII small subunit [Clostridium tetanomorphum DSM 665]MBC2396569.1 exodeoxyribonuclease VII small subunit [Clostridium tetanomorphum]MBP1863897.1 exodeoxyribonuclease VII small subunit [Clostridium tetanomorphum]NRS84975.1 exodeoxyribonuclease VII small subunit [Clostridium tetanomorphum]NRZ98191.1 exodeoxyribonuclease VII small subunit [Clostridium tetanomorphum]
MPKKTENYENLIKKLEDIVDSMDTGELSLEDSMKKYEEGIKTCNKLYKMLDEAEGKIKILTKEGEKEFNEIIEH